MTVSRRAALSTIFAAPLTGVVIGYGLHRGTGLDLTFVAKEWLRDARALGMLVMLQPDGGIWRSVPVGDGRERAEAREAHWIKLQDRPRLLRAVMRVARSGFVPEAHACA